MKLRYFYFRTVSLRWDLLAESLYIGRVEALLN